MVQDNAINHKTFLQHSLRILKDLKDFRIALFVKKIQRFSGQVIEAVTPKHQLLSWRTSLLCLLILVLLSTHVQRFSSLHNTVFSPKLLCLPPNPVPFPVTATIPLYANIQLIVPACLTLPVTPYTVLHCIALHCTALHSTALYCTALHSTALHCNALKWSALHCTALYYTALHNTALHCTFFTSLHSPTHR